MKRKLCVTGCTLFCCQLLTAHWLIVANAGEFRGLWVDAFGPGFLNAEEVGKLADDCRRYNFNAVFVEMRRRADAFYMPEPPNEDPRTIAIPADFDALAEIIRQCHKSDPRIQVHCWVVSHFVWARAESPEQPGHIFNKHPEYLTSDSIGQKFIAKGYYLDPGNPDANQTICNMARDIVRRYDIDGLHWDYFRYPTQDSGYNEAALRRYREEFGQRGNPAPNDPHFSEWRRRQMTDFLRWVNSELLEIKPQLITSVAVFANYQDSCDYRFADWAAWSKEGIVDLCLPMNFSTNNERLFFPRVEQALNNADCARVYMGQGAYMNSKENTLFQLQFADDKGFPGTVLYSYRSCNSGQSCQQATFGFLKQQLQPVWINAPALPWKTKRGIVKGTVSHKASGAPLYNAVVTLSSRRDRPVRTEPHGKYAFFNLEPGPCTLTAGLHGLASETKTISVKAGDVLTLDFTLNHE